MNAEAEGSAAAADFRTKHRLGVQPLGDLVALIEQATGMDVAVLDAGPDEHGLTMRDPMRDNVLIGVARTTRPMRQRSTLAHELGHVIFEDWVARSASGWSARNPQEVRADAFARHLLVPQAGLREFIDDIAPVTQAVLSDVVQRFLISPAIAVIALHQAGFINVKTKAEWKTLTTHQLAVRYGWGDQYRALQAESNQRRAPQRLLARAIKGYVEGVLPVQTIATLRDLPAPAVEAELRGANIVPRDRPIPWAEASQLPDVEVDLSALDEDLKAPDHDTDKT